MSEDAFLAAMADDPDNPQPRLVFADWLEERGDPRGELLRLLHTLTQSVEVPDRSRLEDRLRSLVASGVQPVGPFFTNSVGMKFAWIPAGTFLMGSPPEEQDRCNDEVQHRVILTKGYYLGIHPATQSAWRVAMGDNPSEHPGDNLPVEEISWDDCQEFLRRLSEPEGRTYRLPTEAEWEYACRGGTTTPFYFGTACNGQQANCDGNHPYGTKEEGPYLETISPVGSCAPNAFGLHDMHGNVDEWCADWFGDYPKTPAINPDGLKEGAERVLRGGSCWDNPSFCRAAVRWWNPPDIRRGNIGFRVAFRPD